MADLEARILAVLLQLVDQDSDPPRPLHFDDLSRSRQASFVGAVDELAQLLLHRPDELHLVQNPRLIKSIRSLLPLMEERRKLYDEDYRDHGPFADRMEGFKAEWEDRAFDLLPKAARALPGDRTTRVLQQAALAYQFGLDIAAIGLSRAAVESLAAERDDRSALASTPQSLWAKVNFSAGNRKGKKGRIRMSLDWRIEDLFLGADSFGEEQAAAAHRIRLAGNAALHDGVADRESARIVLDDLRVVLVR